MNKVKILKDYDLRELTEQIECFVALNRDIVIIKIQYICNPGICHYYIIHYLIF
jgi:hypothetical protein